jgi:hypothetical protein
MALFFDTAWFDARLAAIHMPKEALASILGLIAGELAEMWKDQREVTPEQVSILAALLNADPEEIASRAGASTRARKTQAGLDGVHARLDRIEGELAAIRAALERLSPR